MLSIAGGWHNDAKSAPTAVPAKNQNVYTQAQSEFAKGSWDTAIPLYRKHLKSVPTDYRAWSQLAAAYYHSGQIRLALDTLRRTEKKTPDKSFNFFYQGMCIAVLGAEPTAVRYWEYAAYWRDEFAAKATYELAVYFYNNGDDAKSRHWLTVYMQKFPKGPEVVSVKELLKSLAANKKIDETKGFDRPDPELAAFKYHRWSLFKTPHFWLIRVGATNIETSGYEPVRTGQGSGTLVKPPVNDSALNITASLGIGPIRQKKSTSFAGYTYKQKWLMDMNLISAWFEDGLSMDLFPLRGDMLERSHQFFGDFRRQIGTSLFVGSYGRLEYSRLGSSLLPSPDEAALKVVTAQTDTQLLIPWLGWSWSPTMRSMFSLYLRKEIHNQSPEHSNKTYEFSGSEGSPAFSFTLSHAMDFPEQRLETSIDLFQYEFIYNDYFLDYTRRGLILGADYNIYKGIGANAIIGYYRDSYKLPHIKTGGCGATVPQSGDEKPSSCPRTDTGNMIQIGLYYSKSTNTRFEGSYTMVENSSNLKVYSGTKNTILLNATWAFPGTKRVTRMTERFADAAFTKDSEQ
jgi:hypothetical protein